MKIITGYEALPQDINCAVAIGKFDGIHIGHQKLLSEIFEQRGRQLISCVFTFDPPPEVLFGKSDGKELMTREEKRSLFEQMGVEILVEFPLNRESAGMEAEAFVREILCDRLHCKYLAAGKDVSFGRGGLGNEELLRRLAPEYGFEVKTIDKVSLHGREVSSTYIRQLVKEGRMEECAEYLGRPYSLTGRIVHGNHMGTGMGFPTANIQVPEHKLMPPKGVYFTQITETGCVHIDKTEVSESTPVEKTEAVHTVGISNVGVKPTISQGNPVGVETCLFDFAGDLYDKELEVSFCHYHRPEMQFENIENLKQQIGDDIAACRKYWSIQM